MDPNNCGGCGQFCPEDGTCTAGVCVCAGTLSLCSGACVDENADPSNCGACGVTCFPNRLCASGACACRPGFDTCGTSGTCAIETSADSANCNSCGNACDAGESCVAGACGPTCPGPNTSCATGTGRTACVDTQTDPANCGGCAGGGGASCHHDQICIAGVCQYYAPVGNADVSCTSCPCTFCASELGEASCCDDPTYGNICLDAGTCS